MGTYGKVIMPHAVICFTVNSDIHFFFLIFWTQKFLILNFTENASG